MPSAAPPLTMRHGACFSYALPPGWQVAEDGAHAVVLIAPDRAAVTVLVGNAGMPVWYPPAQFAHEKLSALGPSRLALGGGRPAPPLPGFSAAVEFDVAYEIGGVACQGLATVHAAPAYDTCTLVMTAAASQASQWHGYAGWLPQVSRMATALHGGAFGARGVMQQSLETSMREAEAQREYRAWSERQWSEVARQRDASADARAGEFREALGATQTYASPWGHAPVTLSTQYAHYWMNRQGHIVGTDDPGADPNAGSTQEWSRLVAARR